MTSTEGNISEQFQNRDNVFTIVACGQTAKYWIPRGHSIGVNDAWKWGKPTDSLLVCNHPVDFRGERFNTIVNSTPKTFYSYKNDWVKWFPSTVKINLVVWYGSLHPGQVYNSMSSPFIAASLAYNLGAQKIILWGVDMVNHKKFNKDNPLTDIEVQTYLQLFRQMKEERGVEVFLGEYGTAFDGLLMKYDE